MLRLTTVMMSDLSLMTLALHEDTMMTPAVVAMAAWMEDTSLGEETQKKELKYTRYTYLSTVFKLKERRRKKCYIKAAIVLYSITRPS